MKRLGIVGWGYWGRNYAKYLDTTIDATLDWVCDLREEALKDAQKCYPHFKTCTNITDLAKQKLDGVIIATPASIHAKIATFFIEHGVPVLLEKPMTNSLDSAIKLEKLVKKKKATVLLGHTFLYNQATRWLKTKIAAGYFGDINYIECKRQSYGPIRNDVNVIWDFASHDLSLVRWITDTDPLTVHATAKKYSRNDREDIAVLTLEYPHNVFVNITVAWMYPIKLRNMTVLGTKKMAVFDDTNTVEPLKIYDTTLKYPTEKDPYHASFLLGDILIPRIKPVDPLYTLLKHFVDCINGVDAPLTSVNDGLHNVMLLSALDESMRQKKAVDYKKWKSNHV